MDTTQGDFETIRLLMFEKIQLRSPTITRATFYEGRAPLEYIESKLAEILDKNPWLQGRLTRQKDKLLLRYPKKSEGVGRTLRVVSIPALRHDMGFSDLANPLKDLVVKRGPYCVDKDEDLFKVIVVNIDENNFAVVVSMSHVFADGYTFYEVYKMLSAAEPVRSLIVERVYSSRKEMGQVIRGGDDTLPWMGSPGFVVNVIGSVLRRRAQTLNLFTIDENKIDEWKKNYAAANKPKFISTNDIITSEFFSKTDCDLMFMTVNFRDRIPNLTKEHAGNYECVIAYQREDFATPELIRSAQADYRRAVSGTLPGFFRSTRVKMGAITNLATLYQEVELPGCRLVFHRPVVDSGPFLPFEHVVMIFKANQNQLSVITCSKEPSVLSKVEILKERVV